MPTRLQERGTLLPALWQCRVVVARRALLLQLLLALLATPVFLAPVLQTPCILLLLLLRWLRWLGRVFL